MKLSATQLGRTVGVRTNLDELQALQSKADAEQKLAESRYYYIMSYLQLLNASGLLTKKFQQEQIKRALYEQE